MKIRQLMKSPVYTCQPLDSLESAAQKLWDHDCGVLPVVDDEDRVCATITDRDVCMAAFTRGARLSDLRVGSAMSKSLVTCCADDDVTVATRRMSENQVRRLPVVDEHGQPCGILSLNDLAVAGIRDVRFGSEVLKVMTAVGSRHRVAPTVAKSPGAGKLSAPLGAVLD